MKLSTDKKKEKKAFYMKWTTFISRFIHYKNLFLSTLTQYTMPIFGIIVTEYSLPARLSEKIEWLHEMIIEESPSPYYTHIFT